MKRSQPLLSKILIGAIALGLAHTASAARIVLVNADPAGSGLNDPTPATPVGGNPGTTVGQQRIHAYQFAMDLWGAVLDSPVTIQVQASFQSLSCTANAATLGSAGSNRFYQSFPGAPAVNTWYHSALADALAGTDLGIQVPGGGGVDIVSRFNANIGTPGCLEKSGWYYGIDGNTPANRSNFLDTVMHELAHGLGFSGLTNLTTGALAGGKGDAYSINVYDNALGTSWMLMTDAERVASAVGDDLVYAGPTVTEQAALVLDRHLTLTSSGTVAGNYAFGTADFGPPATEANFAGSAVLVKNGSGSSQGCTPDYAVDVEGKIAVIDDGGCSYGDKSFIAQHYGATGVLIAYDRAGPPPQMSNGYSNNDVPTLSVSQSDGTAIKAGLPGVTLGMKAIPNSYVGADANGRVKLYAPATLRPGSTFSHYDVSVHPNALMEPMATPTLEANLNIDLTPALFKDEGWRLAAGNARIGAFDSGVPALQDGGQIQGASLTATSKLCEASATGLLRSTAYLNCMTTYINKLSAAGLITPLQGINATTAATAHSLTLVL
jgi:hypothetical protein